MDTHPFNKIRAVQLLVGGAKKKSQSVQSGFIQRPLKCRVGKIWKDVLSAIISASHREKEDINTKTLRKREGHGNGATLPRKVGILTVDGFGSLLGRFKVPMGMIGEPWLTAMEVLDREFVLTSEGLEMLLEVLDDEWVDEFGCLGWNETDGELSGHFRGDDSFGTWCIECTLDPMDG